jgi:hypothetical protein
MVKLCKISAVVLLAGVLFTTCDMEMGLGPQVDLDAPILTVTHIIRPDGTVVAIEEGAKLFIGHGLRVAVGFQLKGTAKDNVRVERILVEEIGDLAELVDGRNPTWDNAVITKPNGLGQLQEWTIQLDGIKKGERVIRISALDKYGNIGPESVKEYTLLVDTDPPFVETVMVERRPGLEVPLLPKAMLKGETPEKFTPNQFAFIDYYQNEGFTLRAAITHDFPISDVWLNFVINDNGDTLFDTGLPRESGTVYAPVWKITEKMFTDRNPIYATGQHFMNVVVTAKAEAGHTGSNDDLTNTMFNICWYPEADIPQIVPGGELTPEGEMITETGGIVPVNVFDDDNVGEVYAAMVTKARWESFMSGTDAEKLAWLTTGNNRETFYGDRIDEFPLAETQLKRTTRNTTIGVSAGFTRGEHRMIVLVRDVKLDQDGKPDVNRPQRWAARVDTVIVFEMGIPVITVSSPENNTSPNLWEGTGAGRKFTIKGTVLDISPVQALRMAWVPAGVTKTGGIALTQNERREMAQEALRLSNPAGTLSNGVKIWDIEDLGPLVPPAPGDKYSSQEFSITLDIFTDFMYQGVMENTSKFLVIYAQGEGGAEYQYLTFLGYNEPPRLTFLSPQNWTPFGEGEGINFIIRAESSVPIVSIKLSRVDTSDGFFPAEEKELSLTPDASVAGEWRASDTALGRPGTYTYRVVAVDELRNEGEQEVFITVSALPTLVRIITPHATSELDATDTWFASDPGGERTGPSKVDRISIQAVFSWAVLSVDTNDGTPRIRLGGFTDNQPRYAYYDSGEGSNALTFIYEVQPGDRTTNDSDPSGGLIAEAIEENGGRISAADLTAATNPRNISNLTNPEDKLPNSQKKLIVDGVAPKITGITWDIEDYDEDYYDPDTKPNGWIRAGAVITIDVTVDKDIKVLGTPLLRLSLNPSRTVDANYLRLENVGGQPRKMVFEYTISPGDETNPGVPAGVNRTDSFASADCLTIRDMTGSFGNPIALEGGRINSTYNIDAVPPAQLGLLKEIVVGTNPRSEILRITGSIETFDGTKVQSTTDGSSWTVSPGMTTEGTGTLRATAHHITISGPTNFVVQARQIDRAGNPGPSSPPEERRWEANSDLVSVICYSPNGAYGTDSVLTFRLIFNGDIYGSATITLGGGNGADITRTATRTLANADAFLEFTWTVTEGKLMVPVEVTAIDITNVRDAGDEPIKNTMTPATGNTSAGDYLRRRSLKVMSIRPTITAGLPVLNLPDPEAGSVLGSSGNTSSLSLTFSHEVWPEKGYIVVRPASGWLIPPVLTNDDFSAVLAAISGSSSLTTTQKTTFENRLNTNYTKTTHGLSKNANGTYASGAPDTDTKYVLNFNQGLNNADLRAAFDAAEYQWQRIEVVSPQVTRGAVNPDGTHPITVDLNKLADGRQWSVGLQGGTFRDEAGNTFAGWQWNDTGAGSWNWNNGTRRFWSDKVAEPVIRVNRVSNNSPTVAPVRNTDFRIDCETPSATINYGWWNKGAAVIPNTTAGGDGAVDPNNPTTTGGQYVARSVEVTGARDPNSNIANATATELNAITIGSGNNGGSVTGVTAVPATTVPARKVGDDDSLYTASKDYIAAAATRSGLADSAKGYEGAFKTVLVYRNPPTENGNANRRYVKIEAVDQRNGAVTTSGFPMSYNDMSGQSSKHLYNASDSSPGGTTGNATAADRQGQPNARDWIFITWEIVTNFWHVGMTVRNGTPDTELWPNREGSDPWSAWNGDWYQHNFRRYGNYGLRIGNN